MFAEPLSYWGGVNAATSAIIDTHHRQVGASIVGRTLVPPGGRGSSSSVLAATIGKGVGPSAILLDATDPIIPLGCLVAAKLYDIWRTVAVLGSEAHRACAHASGLEVTADDRHATVRVIV
jgi:uncharacterized protein